MRRSVIMCGDALRSLQLMPDESVQCCVTSPPYWGLRDYGTGTWRGGSAACDHKTPFQSRKERPHGKMNGGFATVDAATALVRARCPKCGALRVDRQLGLEASPDEYVARMVEIFHQVKRVLRDDGTLWLNLGDSYAAGTKGSGGHNKKQDGNAGSFHQVTHWQIPPGLKPKDLVGIPWRVAFALQADGWYLRSDIIWAKPNPMPESVTDRPTKAHEYLFLLAKSKQYYYDAGAIAEACQTDTRGKPRTAGNKQHKYVRAYEQSDTEEHRTKGGLLKVADVPWHTRNRRTIWTVASHPFSGAKLLADYVGDDGIPYTASPDCPVHGHLARRRKVGMPGCDERSSKRGRILTTLVDHVETSESTARTANRTTQHVARVDSTCKCVKVSIDHFATFPPKLIEPCILAGAPRGGLVLDPFSGAGTTGLVAGQLGRDFLGIELNPEYCRMARGRIAEAA